MHSAFARLDLGMRLPWQCSGTSSVVRSKRSPRLYVVLYYTIPGMQELGSHSRLQLYNPQQLSYAIGQDCTQYCTVQYLVCWNLEVTAASSYVIRSSYVSHCASTVLYLVVLSCTVPRMLEATAASSLQIARNKEPMNNGYPLILLKQQARQFYGGRDVRYSTDSARLLK